MVRRVYLLAIALLVLCYSSASRAARVATSEYTEGLQGRSAEVFFNAFAEGADVATAEFDAIFPDGLAVRSRTDGSPDCDDFAHVHTVVASFPDSCAPGCRTVHLQVILGTPLPPGDLGDPFVSCIVDVPGDFPPGFYSVSPANPRFDDRNGAEVPAHAVAGTLIVPEVPKSGSLKMGSAEGAPGKTVTVDAVLTTTVGAQIVVIQNDFDLNPFVQAGKLSCRVNPDIDQRGTFDTTPRGCTATGTCTILSADVGDETHHVPYFSGDVVYSCDLHIAADTPPGVYPLGCEEVLLRDYETGLINSHCEGGEIRIIAATEVPATDTPTPTATVPVSTHTPTTEPPTASPSAVVTATAATRGSGGCSVVGEPAGGSLWPLLAAGAVLGCRRRMRKHGLHR